MTQLPSDLWVGISGPAQVRLHDASPPIGVKAPTSATTLLNMTDDAKVISGAVTFQERVSGTSKKGGEFTFRKDLCYIDVNDKINLTDHDLSPLNHNGRAWTGAVNWYLNGNLKLMFNYIRFTGYNSSLVATPVSINGTTAKGDAFATRLHLDF